MPKVGAGNLVEFKRAKSDIERNYYNQMLMIQNGQGKSVKWAAIQFKLKFNKWPPFSLCGDIWGKRKKG